MVIAAIVGISFLYSGGPAGRQTTDVNAVPTIRLIGRVEPVAATRLRVRVAPDSEWKRIRLFALRESTQRSIRKRAVEFTNKWCTSANGQSDLIEMRVYVETPNGLTAADLKYTYTWGNGASPEDRNKGESRISLELLSLGLAKLDEQESSSLGPDDQRLLRKAQAQARADKLGMWHAETIPRADA